MRKSIKKLAATLMAATMVLGSLSMAYADDAASTDTAATEAAAEEKAPDIQDIVKEGQVIYSIGANGSAAKGWAPLDVGNAMEETNIEGVYKANVKISAQEEKNEWARRFGIIQTSYTSEKEWNRVLVGVPSADAGTTDKTSNCLSNIRINVDKDTEVTVYFDSTTYAVAVKDSEGNDVPYLISWVGNDDDETYYSPEDLTKMSVKDYMDALSTGGKDGRVADLNKCGIIDRSSMPDFVKLRDELIAKLAGNAAEKAYVYTPDNIQDIVADGETIYSIGANGATIGWAPLDVRNMMEATEIDGVYKADVMISAQEEGNEWARRFGIIQTDDNTGNVWNRVLLGVPEADPSATDSTSQCITNIRVNVDKDTRVTVYFDSKTFGVAVKDSEGNDVPYLISWVGNDDDETYYSPEELSALTVANYIAGLVEASRDARKGDLEKCGITEDTVMPDFVTLRDQLIAKLDGKAAADEYVYKITKLPTAESNMVVATEEELATVQKDSAITGAAEAGLPQDVKVALNTVEEKEVQAAESFLAEKKLTDKKSVLVDIKLESNGAVITTQPNGKITVVIPVFENLKSAKYVEVFRKDDTNGQFVSLGVNEVKDGKITFESDHFSTYLFVEAAAPAPAETQPSTQPSTPNNQGPQTGDTAPIALFVVLLAAVAVVTVVAKKKEA